jgi:hypothetical protein
VIEGDRAGEVLTRAVRINGIDVGEPVDVLLDPDLGCVLGLEVHCRDGVNRFLPWLAGELDAGELSIGFPLALLDQPELAYYRERALALNVLRRLPVAGSNGGSSRIADVLVESRGRIRALVVEDGHGERAVAPSHVRMKEGVVFVENDELQVALADAIA